MLGAALGGPVPHTTSHKVVIPFYAYAAASFLVATILLLIAGADFTGHWFQPRILSITHLMALGWATMIILGACHQLVPVLIGSDLYSKGLAQLSFGTAAIGIPLLVYGFHVFDLGWPARWGGGLVVTAVLAFTANIALSIARSRQESVHAVFVLTATLWLLLTVSLGLALLFNFTSSLLPRDSLHYLALHAHLGVVGWFLLLVLGVGSRLIPMFLISKYGAPRLLWAVFALVNAALIAYVLLFLLRPGSGIHPAPVGLVLAALLLFAHYCRQAHKERIRRKVDDQMKVSLLSVALLLVPVAVLVVLLAVLLPLGGARTDLVLLYGFTIFFGWLTAIILGMTFKTLPFIVWNKVYHHRASMGKVPGPRDLFGHAAFAAMAVAYLAGFAVFACGIVLPSAIMLKGGAVLLVIAAALYNWNVMRLLTHKPFGK